MNKNNYFIQAIIKALGSDKGVAAKLSNILSLGKESIYRRIRGDIPFTLDEAIEIARQLDISIDELYLRPADKQASFQINLLNIQDPASNYCEILSGYIKTFKTLKTFSTINLLSAYNVMPYSLLLAHDLTARFHLYKWFHLVKCRKHHTTFSEFTVPNKVREIEQSFRNENQHVKNATFILDRNIFLSFAKDISLFVELELVTEQEKQILKKELLSIISTVDTIAYNGHYPTGNKVNIYLSNITLDASFTLFEAQEFEMVHLRVFSINGIESQNKEICNMSRAWLYALENNSNSITQCDSMLRIRYFEEQRSLINQILT